VIGKSYVREIEHTALSFSRNARPAAPMMKVARRCSAWTPEAAVMETGMIPPELPFSPRTVTLIRGGTLTSTRQCRS
jgi:hypothetical protein